MGEPVNKRVVINGREYIHTVYPLARGLIEDNGVVREMTPEELEPINEAAERAFAAAWCTDV